MIQNAGDLARGIRLLKWFQPNLTKSIFNEKIYNILIAAAILLFKSTAHAICMLTSKGRSLERISFLNARWMAME